MSALATHTKNIAELHRRGDATEFSYRTDIENMLAAATVEFEVAVDILQEPSRTKNFGAPDFRLSTKGGGVIGYIECKQPGANLNKLTTQSQLEKYRALSINILVTDSFRWLLLREGKNIADVTLTEKPNAKVRKEFTELLCKFMQSEPEKVGDSKRLAEALARRCAMLRDGLQSHEKDNPEKSSLHGLLHAFQTALDTELSFAKFADAFAQTLVYSMLLAKLKAPNGDQLNLYNLNRYIPGNFAVIREITMFLQGLDDERYDGIRWVVEDVLSAINGMDAHAVAESMSYQNRAGFADGDDPYIYFYENFLAAYDSKLREQRGVYYTPPPVVKFIVRAVDDLLRDEFELANGLAETDSVTALDFAAGTGTFMLEMMRIVLTDATPARRDLLTHGHILKNFYGFELLIAPYAIAHLKLSQFLADNGAPLDPDERINIFLTNTLEQISKQVNLPTMPKLAAEANHAQRIKSEPVLVITGNPPYSVASQNKGAWIVNLLNDYKMIDGEPLGERNPKVLQDDYVKFIRFAQHKMQNQERGIIAIITNHVFLNGPVFRGMRQSLMNTFDAMYFLDLHGSTKRVDTVPDGIKDENVFDIQQGVSISILVKNPTAKRKGIFRADLFGKRNFKYKSLVENNLQTTEWTELKPAAPFYLFTERDNTAAAEYQKLWSVKDIFMANSTGIKSHRDHFAFAFESDEIKNRIGDLINPAIETADLREKYKLKDNHDWKLENVRKALTENHSFEKFLRPCMYRPFDARWCYYGGETMTRHRPEVMQHMLKGEGKNLGLVTVRQSPSSGTWQHISITEGLIESCYVSNKSAEMSYLFPLYRYDTEVDRVIKRENFTPQFRNWIDDRYGFAHTAEQILGCIYAIMHSPDYRKKYSDFLRTDFPRIPFPQQNAEFKKLSTLGNQLINAHLLRENCTGSIAELNGDGTSHLVEKIRYNESNQRLYFNATEYLAPIPPQVFHFQIGGYHPIDKYLKSRKGRKLTLQDTETLSKAANAIAFTLTKMQEMDGG